MQFPHSPTGTALPPVDQDPWSTPPAPAGQPASLLEPHFTTPFQNYRDKPGPETSGPLLTALKPVIDEALRSYGGSEAGTATARARAKVLALDAVNRYDPSRAKLRTHLLSHLRGLRRTVERSTAGVYVPEQWRIDSHRVDTAVRDARDELGREPSDGEIADRVSLPVGRVRRARAAPGVLAGSQFEEAFQVNSPNEAAWQRWVDAIYHTADPKDQLILDHSLGLHGKPVLPANKIAEMVGLSGGAISQRKARLQKDLDQFDTFMMGRNR